MMKKSVVLCTALIGALLVAAPHAARADMHTPLKDAGFELRLPSGEGGWILFEESRFSANEARTGSQSMLNAGLSRTVAFPPFFLGSVSGSYQEFPAEPGSRWRLTGYGQAPTALEGTPAFGIVQVSFFDAKGRDLGTIETAGAATPQAKISNEVNNQSPVREWIFLDTGIATAPAGTASVQAFTLYVDFSGTNTSQGVYFDDLSLCVLEDDDDVGAACDASDDDMGG